MNRFQKHCVIRAVCFAATASFIVGLCMGYFINYAKLDFTLLAVCVGMVAVVTVCVIKMVCSISDYLDYGHVQARRHIHRTIRRARQDFVSQSRYQ